MIVICNRCDRNMNSTNGCDPVTFPDGTAPVLYGQEPGLEGIELRERCHDCGARLGFSHHLYCDVESCPRCKQQLLFCGCWANQATEEPS